MKNEEWWEIKNKAYKQIEENCKMIKELEEEQEEKIRYFNLWIRYNSWLSYPYEKKKLKNKLQNIEIKIALLEKSNDEIYEFLKGGYKWA